MQQHQISSTGPHGGLTNRFNEATFNLGGGLLSDIVPEDDHIWQAGETLSSFATEIEELKSTFHSMISTICRIEYLMKFLK